MGIDLSQIMQLLIQYKYLILFPIVVVEGPIATIAAGFILSLGYMNFFAVYLVIMVGDIAGDAVYYVMGRFGGRHFVERWGRYIGLNPERVFHFEKHFEKHGGKTLLLGKLAHGIGAIFLIAAGLTRMSFLKFISANFFATLIKSLALLLIGFYFGQALVKINSILEFVGAMSISAGIIILLMFISYYYNKKEGGE